MSTFYLRFSVKIQLYLYKPHLDERANVSTDRMLIIIGRSTTDHFRSAGASGKATKSVPVSIAPITKPTSAPYTAASLLELGNCTEMAEQSTKLIRLTPSTLLQVLTGRTRSTRSITKIGNDINPRKVPNLLLWCVSKKMIVDLTIYYFVLKMKIINLVRLEAALEKYDNRLIFHFRSSAHTYSY